MARLARLVIPGLPHHITQRGNRRQQTFFNQGDYAAYLELMSEWCRDQGVEIWSYCLMPNHTHLIAVPSTENGLRWAIGEAHRRYTRRINFREKWRGYLWQGRFASFVMDEPYLLAAARYIELNPLRAGLVAKAGDWPWSSARAHLAGRDDQLVRVAPLLAMIPDWCAFLNSAMPAEELRDIRQHTRTGRPLGNETFLDRLEGMIGRILKPQKRGRKPREVN
jgi:putative transposase